MLLVLSGCTSVKKHSRKAHIPAADTTKIYDIKDVSFNVNPIVRVGPDSRGASNDVYILAEGVVNKRGVFTDIKILELKPDKIISVSKAKKYLSKWRFRPATKDGKRVNVKHQQEWFFKI